MLDKILNKFSKISWNKLTFQQRWQYYEIQARIEWVLTLEYFLSLRGKIKKEIQNNYTTKTEEEITESIIEYDAYDSVDYKGFTLWKEALNPLIQEYVKQQIKNIEKHTLKLEL
jgi:hypothetical protein